jgi:hypothetical protein
LLSSTAIARRPTAHERDVPRARVHERTRHGQAEGAETTGDQVRGVGANLDRSRDHRRRAHVIRGERECDLPDVPRLRHIPECVRHLTDREHADRQRLELSGGHSPHQILEQRANDLRALMAHPLQVERRVGQVAPERRQPHGCVPVDVASTNLDEAPVGSQGREPRRDRFTGEGVEDDVDPRATRERHHVLGERQRAGVEHVLDAERMQVVVLGAAPGGGEHLRAGAPRDLHRGQADASGGRVNQHPLTGAQPGQTMQSEPRSRERDWQCRSDLGPETGRLAYDQPSVRERVRAEAIEGDRHHLVTATEPGDARAHLHHATGAFDSDRADSVRMPRQAS